MADSTDILHEIDGRRFGMDVAGEPVWNKPDGSRGRMTAVAAAALTNVVGTGAGQVFRSVKNFSPKNYPLTRKALNNQVLGTSFQVLCIGDSTTEGFNGVTTANCVSFSWVRRLADLLTSRGLKAGWQNVLGDHQATLQQSVPISTVDTRVTALPTGWVFNGPGGFGLSGGIGGYGFSNVLNTNPLTFTPTVQTDTFDLFYFDITPGDSIVLKSGAAGATTPSTGGTIALTNTSRIKKATATFTLGSNVWTIQKATANTSQLLIQGFNAYNSTLPEISLLNCGCGAQLTSYFTATASFWDALSSVTLSGGGLVSTLAIINIGINDWLVGTTQASMTASLTTLVAGLQAVGTEVLLVVPVPSVVSSASLASQAAIVAAIYSVAIAKNCAIVDLTERWISGAAAAANGYLGDNVVHPSSFGYVDVAAAISDFVFSLTN